MTICLAALCRDERGDHAVVAADRMVTAGGFIEFEHDVPKLAAASSSAIAMPAGDALLASPFCCDVADELAASSPPIAEIADELAESFDEARRERIEQKTAPSHTRLASDNSGKASTS